MQALRAAYDGTPPGVPVRLAKRTSNLFRFRAPGRGPGLDVRRLDQVLSVDPAARTADVQGMVTYERLVDANVQRSSAPIHDVINLLRPLRDAWSQVAAPAA